MYDVFFLQKTEFSLKWRFREIVFEVMKPHLKQKFYPQRFPSHNTRVNSKFSKLNYFNNNVVVSSLTFPVLWGMKATATLKSALPFGVWVLAQFDLSQPLIFIFVVAWEIVPHLRCVSTKINCCPDYAMQFARDVVAWRWSIKDTLKNIELAMVQSNRKWWIF